jgi:hypothetical protein
MRRELQVPVSVGTVVWMRPTQREADPADCQALPFERLATTRLARRFPARIRGSRFLAGLRAAPDDQSRRTP